jgi:hypothetical protein
VPPTGNLRRQRLADHSPFPQEPQVREVVPNILGGCITQIETLFARINAISPREPILRHLSQMINMANQVIEVARKPDLNLGGY